MGNTNLPESRPKSRSARLIGIILLGVVGLVLFGAGLTYRSAASRQGSSASTPAQIISASALEERYGIQITLIAVTAGGGMVDFRFKVVDAEKARQFQDPKKLPILTVAGSSLQLKPPGDLAQKPDFKPGGAYYALYSNSGSLVKRGTPVSVRFGDLQLEPIIAR